MGVAGLSLIFWIINCQCWFKKSCCLKEYHNPQNIRTFWWLCFIFLCGVLACCVSGILVSINFGKKVTATNCIYERIYYDSKYGELKNETKWVGLENTKDLIEGLKAFVNNNHHMDSDVEKEYKAWTFSDQFCLNKTVKYPKAYIIEIGKIYKDCKDRNSQIYRNEDSKLIYDNSLECNKDSFYFEYINETTRICKYFYDESEKIYEFMNREKENREINKIQINQVENELKNISADLDNYQTNFLDKVHYYIKISNIFGYIVVLVYYSIVSAIVLCSCVFLCLYTYFKEQKIIYTLMHVAWNILKFFSFSFFLFGAAFGSLYLCARDLIGYNQYIFTTNLEENVDTKFLPTNEAKVFLGFCMKNTSDNNYINKLNMPFIKNYISVLYNNLKEEKYIAENYNFTPLNQSYSCYSSINRRLQEDTTDGYLLFDINFTNAGNILSEKIKDLYRTISNQKRLRILEEVGIIKDLNSLKDKIETLNCGFLKNELQILFNSLYDLSIDSRISCALCCCIGFFIELSVNFYLLVIYHYNNIEFKEGKDNQAQFRINQQRKFDLESQNEFMDKSKPPNLKSKNKKLDFEFPLN